MGYIDLRQTTLEAVAELVIQKLLNASGWDTWEPFKIDINNFSAELRSGVDEVLASACSIILNLLKDNKQFSDSIVTSLREKLQGIRIKPNLDIEITCLDDSGIYIYHPWPTVIGHSLHSLWLNQIGFADWVLKRVIEMGRGYLTWKDYGSSDPNLAIELKLQPRLYQRRTIFAFRRLPILLQSWFTVAVEGHEIVRIGPSQKFKRLLLLLRRIRTFLKKLRDLTSFLNPDRMTKNLAERATLWADSR